MPLKIHWSPTADAEIRALRAAGATWNAVAAALRLGHIRTLMEHGRGLGARRPEPPPADPDLDALGFDDFPREPLRPGHPASWELLVAGTGLAGVLYPFPPVVDEAEPAGPDSHGAARPGGA
jgi:hypothetical protein